MKHHVLTLFGRRVHHFRTLLCVRTVVQCNNIPYIGSIYLSAQVSLWLINSKCMRSNHLLSKFRIYI